MSDKLIVCSCFSLYTDLSHFIVISLFTFSHYDHLVFIVALRKYDKASFFQTKKEDPEHVKSEEETIANILKHDKSGAAILYRMKSQAESLSSDHPLTKDVIGIVATLGKVDDNNLSRLVHFTELLFILANI